MTAPVGVIDFLHWAKTRSKARFNLARSGVLAVKWSELGVDPATLEITGDNGYGYGPLVERIAARYRARPENVVTAQGASMANYLVFAAVLAPGDRVLIERPCYEPLYRAAAFAGAEVDFFDRTFEEGYRVDPARIAAGLTNRTRLVVLTNLHNPSGVLLDEGTLRQVGHAAAQKGALVLVDEAYLEFASATRPAFSLDGTFISTNSLTKVYGLDGLRCGWILAAPEVAERARHVTDHLHSEGVLLGEIAATVAFDRIEWLADRSRRLVEANRALLDAFLTTQRDAIEVVAPPAGTLCFPRLRFGSGAALATRLRESFETTVVPGDFFCAPRHFRIAIGNDTAVVRNGLERVGRALGE